MRFAHHIAAALAPHPSTPPAAHHQPIHVPVGWWFILVFVAGVVVGVILDRGWDRFWDWFFDTSELLARWVMLLCTAVGAVFLFYALLHWGWHLL